MAKTRSRRSQRVVRHLRVRQKVKGTSERPRLAVFRSLRQVYAQIIDDTQGITITCASSQDKEVMEKSENLPKTQVSKLVGTLLAQRAEKAGVKTVVYDRGGYKFHGRVKALADAAREEGLVF